MDRELSGPEHDALVAMIRSAVDDTGRTTTIDRDRWLAQVGGTRVTRRCPCGTCPSIELADARPATPGPHSGPPRRRSVLSASTPGALVLLFVDDDRLSYLELAPVDQEGRFAEFPPVASFRF